MGDRTVDPALHTGLCNIYIKHFKKCMDDPERTLIKQVLFSPCETVRIQMNMCFDNERLERSRIGNSKFKRRLRKEKEEEVREAQRKSAEVSSEAL